MGCDYYLISYVSVVYTDGLVKQLNTIREPRYLGYIPDEDPDDDAHTKYEKYRKYFEALLKSFTKTNVLYTAENGWTKSSYKHIETHIGDMTNVMTVTRETYAEERS